jgi:hypothetical protein
MIRVRRASMISTLTMLAWAASATAECAFVMWISPLTTTQWDPSESFQVLAETRRIRS